MTKEEIEAKVECEGGVGETIMGYGLNPNYLPEDAPQEIKCAWIRLYNQGRKDLDLIEDWLYSDDISGLHISFTG